MFPRFARKLANSLVRRGCRWTSRDEVTFTKIKPRPDLLEIGSAYGGWVVPAELLHAGAICYCVGCGEDISFDLGLIERFGCDVFAFDPTPRAIAYVQARAGDNPKYHFTDVGVWDQEDRLPFFAPANPAHVSHSLLNLQKTGDYIEIPVTTLRKLMQGRGHRKIDLLKLDIEGAEYRVIDNLLDEDIDVRILCVEYDECSNALDGDYRSRIRASVGRLAARGYSLVCAQGAGNYTFVREREFKKLPAPARAEAAA